MQVSGQLDAVTLFELVATESLFSLELEVRMAADTVEGEKNFCFAQDLNPGYPIFQSVVYNVKSEIQQNLL
jgi:hypothetical protein